MEWQDWAPTMRAIRAEFGYPEEGDAAAARDLQTLLHGQSAAKWTDVGRRLRNRSNVAILGCGPGLERTPGAKLDGRILVAADGATGWLREQGLVPDLVVTDLDGDPEDLAWAAAHGSLMVVHAHGDNRGELAAQVPRLGPLVLGTHQVDPATPGLQALRNVGGFTDGDRAVLLCEWAGAKAATLHGFETDQPPGRYSHRWDARTKPAKLAWAGRIVAQAHARGAIRLVDWRP